MTFTRPDGAARAELTRHAPDHYRVFGHVEGIALGLGGLGREYRGEDARERALRASVELVYGKRVQRLGESLGKVG